MTEDDLQAIAKRWGWPGVPMWDANDVGLRSQPGEVIIWGMEEQYEAAVNAPSDIAALLAEVRFLRGQLSDLCQDSRAVAEVGRLRVVLGEVRGLTDAANDGWRDLLSRHPGAAIRLHTMQDTIDAALEGGGE